MSAKIPKRENKEELGIEEIALQDGRYSPQAYYFVFEALHLTQRLFGKNPSSTVEQERHVTGRQLLEGVRQLAVEQFGYMARVVLKGWGVRQTRDFGEIVFSLVSNGLMGKTEEDALDDFEDGYDFQQAFDKDFKFAVLPPPAAPKENRAGGEA